MSIPNICDCEETGALWCVVCFPDEMPEDFEPSIEELEQGESDHYAKQEYYDFDDFNDGEFWG